MVRRIALLALSAAFIGTVACDSPPHENSYGAHPSASDEPGSSGHSVQYDAKGADSGLVPVDESQYPAGAAAALARNYGGLERADYTLDGWNAEPDGTGVQHYIGEGFLMPGGDTVLYPQWSDAEQCWTMNATTGTLARYLADLCGAADRASAVQRRISDLG